VDAKILDATAPAWEVLDSGFCSSLRIEPVLDSKKPCPHKANRYNAFQANKLRFSLE